MSNLFLRAASAVVLLPGVIGLVLWDNRWGFSALVLLAATLALREWSAMALRGRPHREQAIVIGAGTGFAAALYLRPDLALPATVATVILVSATQLGFARDIDSAGPRLGVSLAGVFYLGPLMMALPLMQRDLPHGERWVLLAMAVTFGCDTGAYFVGRAIGRHKLAPRVSPGKTWEGFFGGLAAALGLAFVARATFFPALTVVDCLAVGLGTGALAPVGDLVESMLKRSAGVKDSGNLIPGHGGMFDRIDALLFVAGFVYLYATHLR